MLPDITAQPTGLQRLLPVVTRLQLGANPDQQSLKVSRLFFIS